MNIKELRKQKYWSQDQLAQMSGLSIRTIQNKDWGETRIAEQGLLTTPPWDWGTR